jgi:hypothetical protein
VKEEQEPLPQAWVPRVVNLAAAAVMLLFLVPLFAHLPDVGTAARVVLVLVAAPFVLLTAMCLMSAARPGSLGRLARRTRRTG